MGCTASPAYGPPAFVWDVSLFLSEGEEEVMLCPLPTVAEAAQAVRKVNWNIIILSRTAIEMLFKAQTLIFRIDNTQLSVLAHRKVKIVGGGLCRCM